MSWRDACVESDSEEIRHRCSQQNIFVRLRATRLCNLRGAPQTTWGNSTVIRLISVSEGESGSGQLESSLICFMKILISFLFLSFKMMEGWCIHPSGMNSRGMYWREERINFKEIMELNPRLSWASYKLGAMETQEVTFCVWLPVWLFDHFPFFFSADKQQ